MKDEQLVAYFESCELSGDEFSHTEHVRVAWWYLRQCPFAEARQRFSDGLRRFAASKGASGRYHETITVAFLLLIAERLRETPSLDWPEFAARHADLLAWNPSILARYYTEERLMSEQARGAFVLPDLELLPMRADGAVAAPGGTDHCGEKRAKWLACRRTAEC